MNVDAINSGQSTPTNHHTGATKQQKPMRIAHKSHMQMSPCLFAKPNNAARIVTILLVLN
jgi:hypothetical protein